MEMQELKKYMGNKLKELRLLHNYTQENIADKLNTTKQTVSRWERGERSITQQDLYSLSALFFISVNDFFPSHSSTLKQHSTYSEQKQNTSPPILNVYNQLKPRRQKKVLNYANEQLEEQNNTTGELSEEKALYKVLVTEKMSAGSGYGYDENNATFTVYTDRDDLPRHDLATQIYGNSMEPTYKNGDIALISSTGYIVNGAVYVVDYNGKSYMKKVYQNSDNDFTLVSINPKYKDIHIKLIDDSIYFNIVGKVIDSFTAIEP